MDVQHATQNEYKYGKVCLIIPSTIYGGVVKTIFHLNN